MGIDSELRKRPLQSTLKVEFSMSNKVITHHFLFMVGMAALLLPTALPAWLAHGVMDVALLGLPQVVDNSDHFSARSARKVVDNQSAGNTAAFHDKGSTAFGSAHRGLTQAINLVHSRAPDSEIRLTSKLDSDGSFIPNLFDSSDANIAVIEQRSLAGSDDALAAFLTVAVHLPDYRERSQRLLLLNAARGSVLALTTLSERALVGFGFEAPDRAASIFFEYLAWATGRWNTEAVSEAFYPSIVRRTLQAECEVAVAFARRVAVQHQAFAQREPAGASTCVDRK